MTTKTQTSEGKLEFGQIKVGFKNIYKYTREFRKSLYIVFALIVISSTIEAINPYIWGRLVDSILSQQYTYVLFSIYIGLIVVKMFIDLRRSLISRFIEENIRISYLEKNFNHVFKLPLSFHKSVKQGETNEKIRTAAQSMRNIFSTAILESLPMLITASIMTIFVFFDNWKFGTIILIALVLYIIVSVREIKPTFALQKLSQKGYRKAGGMTQDVITNIRSVKDYNTENFESERINKTYKEEGFTHWYKSFSIQRRTNTIQGLIRFIVQAVIILQSIFLVSKGSMTIGQLVAYISYVGLIFSPLNSVFNNWRDIQNSIVSVNEAEKIIHTDQEIYIPDHSEVTNMDGDIEFKNVSFFYDEHSPVLKNISFTVHTGDTVALVGESGVGKSTLIDLLSGYHFAQEGKITLNNVDIKNLNLNILRRSIAVVSQEISLFNDTILNNIKYGNFDKTFEEVVEACKKAHCFDFIEKFPEQWEQIVGEKGLKLSVGQKQRIAIARAILKNPKILILDEPTSALDAGSEKIITESLDELMKEKTTFIVAHRLSTVRQADTILVFKNGEIIEKGTHQELIQINNGEYRRLYELQIGLHN